MPIYVIKKDTHRAKPTRLRLYYNKKSFNWGVRFDDSAKYQIGSDQNDVNKLRGIKYFSGDYSARFGWRYNPAFPEMVEIMAYVHDAGVVTAEIPVIRIGINIFTSLHLSITDNTYEFSCNEKTISVEKTHMQKLSFAQNLYFGGTQTAPHNINVIIETK